MTEAIRDWARDNMISILAKEHKLANKISSKWNFAIDEIENNLEDLAKYVADGIVELII